MSFVPTPSETTAAAASAPHAACLLLHGFAGSPFEMEPLAPALRALGCTVDIPTLPGHDEDIPAFRRTFYKDWLACAEERYTTLAATHRVVVPIGFSMGASLALCLAARHTPPAVVCLAPPHRLYSFFPFRRRNLSLMALPLLHRIVPELRVPQPSPESRALAPFRGYASRLCLPQLHSLGKGLEYMRSLLPRVTSPLLIIQEPNDRLCPANGAWAIARATTSTEVVIRMPRMNERITSHHMLTTHAHTRDTVARETAAFVGRFCR